MHKSWLLYELKHYLNDKDVRIWNLLFPFIYLTGFFLALYNVSNGGGNIPFEAIPLTIVGETEQVQKIEDFLFEFDLATEISLDSTGKKDTVSDDTNKEEFLIKYLPAKDNDAASLLEDGKVFSVVHATEPIELEFLNRANELSVTVVQEVFSNYERVQKMGASIGKTIEDRAKKNPEEAESLKNLDFGEIMDSPEKLKERYLDLENRGNAISTDFAIYFAVIAYIAFFPMTAGVTVIEEVEANQSALGHRLSSSPVPKWKRFLAKLLPLAIFHTIITVFFYIYVRILGIDLGSKHVPIVLTLILTTFCSIFTGTAIGALFSNKKSIKLGLAIAIPLLFGFMSRMMNVPIDKMLQGKADFINQINPILQTSKVLYKLYADSDVSRIFPHIITLVLFVSVMIVLTVIGLRRQNYENV